MFKIGMVIRDKSSMEQLIIKEVEDNMIAVKNLKNESKSKLEWIIQEDYDDYIILQDNLF